MSDRDLVYDGRARKRPPGASEMVQRIYGLLLEHPQGMTLPEIHEHFRDGWLETDAYRAYENHMKQRGLMPEASDSASDINAKKRKRRVPDYGTPEFKEKAQHWWIRIRLQAMKSSRTARREGSKKDARWYAGNRAPRAIIACEAPKRGYHVIPINAARAKALADADTAAHVRREELKASLLEALNDKRFKGRGRDLARRSYNYLIGH